MFLFILNLDKLLNRNVNVSNYSNIAFDSSKTKKTSFKENSKFVDMLKDERKKIASYNKISPLYLVYNDKTLQEIVSHKPVTIKELKTIKGFKKQNVKVFGPYLIGKIREFLQLEKLNETPEVNVVELTAYLKNERKKIAKYNKIDKLYNVFNNATLDEIVEKLPKNINELKEIKGIGPAKADLWGEYLLKQIATFLSSDSSS